jgi:DNA-binding response OmpR family regulator
MTTTRLMVEMWLAKYNYDVATAESIIAGGLRLAQSERFDLYVLDTNLSDGKGTELCAKIRRFDPLTR